MKSHLSDRTLTHSHHLSIAFIASIAANGPSPAHHRHRRPNPSSPNHHNPSSGSFRFDQIHLRLRISPPASPSSFPATSTNSDSVNISRNDSRRKYHDDALGPIAAIHASARAAGAAERPSGRYGEFAAYDGRTGGLSSRLGRVVGRGVSIYNVPLYWAGGSLRSDGLRAEKTKSERSIWKWISSRSIRKTCRKERKNIHL